MQWHRSIVDRCVVGLLVSTTAVGVASAQTAQPDKTQAAIHFKAAMIALENKDLEGAEEELREAQKFDPAEPLIFLNLATVQVNMSPGLAAENLDRAEALGLKPEQQKQAQELRPKIVYALGRVRRLFIGTWVRKEVIDERRITIDERWTFSPLDDGGLGGFASKFEVYRYPDGTSRICKGGGRSSEVDDSWLASVKVADHGKAVLYTLKSHDNDCRGVSTKFSDDQGSTKYRVIFLSEDELRVTFDSNDPLVFKRVR